jgi:hypothetical protein
LASLVSTARLCRKQIQRLLIAVGITPGTFNFRRDKLVAEEKKIRDRGNQRKNLEKLSYGIPNADDNQLGIVNRF